MFTHVRFADEFKTGDDSSKSKFQERLLEKIDMHSAIETDEDEDDELVIIIL